MRSWVPVHQEFADPQTLAKNRANSSTCFPTLEQLPGGVRSEGLAGRARGATGGAARSFGITSHYFRLTSFITIGSTEFNLYSLLYQDRGGVGGPGTVRPIQRSFTPD